MPVNTCLSTILTTRFDFGVPLEDVFPPNDIHPRLKYLLGKACESYITHGKDIENLLRYRQGTMEERLQLKEKLVLNLDYHINLSEYSPGAYFWVIRHFLGLLPLPVLPNYAKGIQFDWNNLSYECKKFLQHYGDKKEKYILDNDIAQTINMLPFENFILLNVLMAFSRRLSTKNFKGRSILNRNSLLVLSKYYCSAMFVRPYRPGYNPKNESYLPLLLYMILRWNRISKHCESIGHPAFMLECDFKNFESSWNFGQRDNNCTQTNIFSNAFFNPEVISVCRNIPYFVNICKNYLKDSSCQTDTDLNRDKCSTIPEVNEESMENEEINIERKSEENAYKLAYIEEELDDLSRKELGEDDNDNTVYQTATDFSFRSVLDKEDHQDWKNIVQDTRDKVKRVEESYIYDDYETFNKEEFNQIGKSGSRSLISKIAKYGFTYTPPRNSARKETKRNSTPEKISPESDTSYVKYPDVCDDIIFENKGKNVTCEIKVDHQNNVKSKSIAQQLFQNDSPRSVPECNSKQNLQNCGGGKKRKKYVLNKIRMSLEFFRALTPKKSTFKRIESRVKYHRMRQGKANTI